MGIALKCRCGAMKGRTSDSGPRSMGRAVCYCDDCQTYAHAIGAADRVLDRNGGTEILPMAHADITIREGIEHLKCLRLSDKGMFRWYAGCCQTPIGNSMMTRKIPYVGLVHTMLDLSDETAREQALGPVVARMQSRFAIGTPPAGSSNSAPPMLIFKTIYLVLKWVLTGRSRPSPFYDDKSGEPRVTPEILAPARREAFRPKVAHP